MDLTCPDCKQPLAGKSYQGVDLDVCPACAGIWFESSSERSTRTVPRSLRPLRLRLACEDGMTWRHPAVGPSRSTEPGWTAAAWVRPWLLGANSA